MEIERKFLVNELPDLSHIEPVHFERYYLNVSDGVEERIQKTNDKYSYEKKVLINELSRSTEKNEITENEFENLKQGSSRAVVRDSYELNSSLSIKIYHGDFEGLVRAEVEFASVEEALHYQPESWMGNEITNTPLGKDSSLLHLDSKSVLKLIGQLSQS